MAKRGAAMDPGATAIEVLADCVNDDSPRMLFGTKQSPGLFATKSAATQLAADFSIGKGWLVEAGVNGKGKTAKPLYRLSSAGRQAIIEQSEPLRLLRATDANIGKQLAQLESIDRDVRDLAERVGQLHGALEPVRQLVTDAAGRIHGQIKGPPNATSAGAVHRNSASTRNGAPENDGWLVEAEREARRHDIDHPLSLRQLFELLQRSWPQLTIGQFHDGLRHLWDQKRIRLAPYTRSMVEIAADRTALFLDGEICYYVRRP